MDDMTVPEEVYFMIDAMYPVAGKINTDERDEVGKPGCFYMSDRNMIHQPCITQDHNAQTKHILGYIGNTRCQTADHINITHRIFSVIPAIPFFK